MVAVFVAVVFVAVVIVAVVLVAVVVHLSYIFDSSSPSIHIENMKTYSTSKQFFYCLQSCGNI